MVLRKKFNGGYQVNNWLGDEYHYVNREGNPQGFEDAAKLEFGENWKTNDLAKECYGFVIYNFGNRTRMKSEPLYIGQSAWILSPDGQEFADLTHR